MSGQANTNNKKSGHPTQPGNRSTAARNTTENKQHNIIQRSKHFSKRLTRTGRVVFSALFLTLALTLILPVVMLATGDKEQAAEDFTTEPTTEYIVAEEKETTEAVKNQFNRYDLTDEERRAVASAVTAEAEGEPFAGKVAVAQCILQACEDDEIGPLEVLANYNYAKSRPEPSMEALDAVSHVFDYGYTATSEPIKYFYAPELTTSSWHESQEYVMTINGHRFFKEAD